MSGSGALTLVEIHYQMVEVFEAHVMSWKQVWMWYNAFNNSRAHADGKQKPICSCTSTMADILCYADACITEHRSTKLNAVGWEVHVLQDSVHSTVHNWTPEKCMHDGHQSSLRMVINLVTWNPVPCIWNIKPIKESSFCSTLLKGMKHGLMWHQNWKKYLWCGNPSFPPSKTYKALLSVRMAMAFP